ncbi:tetratricopeptide repeat protein [Cytophagaceae bacterium ABcell3]|nr:tetratricopeptide repeat protein [Cytophagaceae bacterium ABcell3]
MRKIQFIIIAALCLWATAVVAQESEVDSVRSQLHYDSAQVNYNNENYEEAIHHYEKAIEYDPHYATAYLKKAEILYNYKELKREASEIFDLVLRSDSNNVGARIYRAEHNYNIDNYELSLSDIKYALNLDSTNSRLYELAAYNYFLLKEEKEKAIYYGLKAQEHGSRDPHTFYILGASSYILDEYENATLYSLKALEFGATNVRLYYILAYSNFTLKNYKQAISFFTKYIQSQDDAFLGQALLLKGKAYVLSGHYDSGIEDLQYAFKEYWKDSDSDNDKVDIFTCLGDAYKGKQEYEKAIENYINALDYLNRIDKIQFIKRRVVPLVNTAELSKDTYEELIVINDQWIDETLSGEMDFVDSAYVNDTYFVNSMICSKMEAFERALVYMDKSVDSQKQSGDPNAYIQSLYDRVRIMVFYRPENEEEHLRPEYKESLLGDLKEISQLYGETPPDVYIFRSIIHWFYSDYIAAFENVNNFVNRFPDQTNGYLLRGGYNIYFDSPRYNMVEKDIEALKKLADRGIDLEEANNAINLLKLCYLSWKGEMDKACQLNKAHNILPKEAREPLCNGSISKEVIRDLFYITCLKIILDATISH